MKITDTSDNDAPNRLTVLLQGDAFSGKTHCLCSFPNPVIVVFDPDTSTIDKHPGIKKIQCKSFAEFKSEVLPYVATRRLHELVGTDVETFGIDTISLASTTLAREIQGDRDRLRVQDFGEFLNDLTKATMTCTEAAKNYDDGRPIYHVVFTTHLTTVTDDTSAVQAIRPAIMGQFRDLLPRLFGSSFVCDQQTTTNIVDGKSQSETTHILRVAPPTRFHISGDRVGGGKFNKLPGVVDGNTFDKLVNLWGIPGDFWESNAGATMPTPKSTWAGKL